MTEPSPARPQLLGIALISAAVLLFELVILRIFSFTIWHHFAFMVISIALLGFAVSGLLLTRWPRLLRNPERGAAAAATACAISMLVSTLVICTLRFDPTQLAKQPSQLVLLGLYFVVLAVPFTAAGLVVGILLGANLAQSGRLYAADLVGAGCGAVSVSLLLPLVSAEGCVTLAAALALSSAAVLAATPRSMQWIRACAAALLVLLSFGVGSWLPIQPGASKQLGSMATREDPFPHAKLIYHAWNALARVDLVEGVPEVEWTRNRLRPTKPQLMPTLVIDGDAATPLVNAAASPEELAYLDHTLPSAPLQAFRPEHVLVIGAGGGADVLTALHFGAKRIDAVEINPDVIDIATRKFATRTGGLFSKPGVNLIHGEGRSFVARSQDRYDLIQISLIDTWAASASGAYSLAEGYLYTVEAFQDYLSHLGEQGVLSITRWGGVPPREILKLCTVAVAALRQRGAQPPGEQIVVLAMGRFGGVLIKPSGFSSADLAALDRVIAEQAFGKVYYPGSTGVELFSQLLNSPDIDRFAREYEYDITPATDNRPYFFQFGRWGDLLRGGAWSEHQLFLSGRLVVAAVLVQALLCALLLLFVAFRSPALRSSPTTLRWRVLGYFLGIGIGFMLIELCLMQRITLFLGSPLLATSIVLATLLVGAGIGSALSTRFVAAGTTPRGLFMLLALAAVLVAFALPPALGLLIGWPLSARLLVTIVIVGALGVLLGMPLPTAMTRLAALTGDGWVGWAWAANGAGSVLGPVLAAVLSIDFGLSLATLAGGVCYLTAYSLFGPLWRNN